MATMEERVEISKARVALGDAMIHLWNTPDPRTKKAYEMAQEAYRLLREVVCIHNSATRCYECEPLTREEEAEVAAFHRS